MADTFRVTMHFQHSYFGFSETWYLPNASYGSLLPKLRKMYDARNSLLEQQYSTLAIRIAKEDNTRHSRLLVTGDNDTSDMGVKNFPVWDRGAYTDETAPPSWTFGPDNSDQTRAALQMQGLVGGKRVCLKYMAGVPDFVSLTEPKTVKDKDNGIWWGLFADYVKKIVNDGWCIKSLNKLQTAAGDLPANPLVPVIGWAQRSTAPSILGMQMQLALPFSGVQGDRIILQGVRMKADGIKSPNGKWLIESVQTDSTTQVRTIWLRDTERHDPSTFKTLGKFRRELYTYTPLDNLDSVRMGIHKRGKPFFSPRGRAKTLRYAS